MDATINESRYSTEIIDKVWDKGSVVPNFDPTRFRKDFCGAWMIKEGYGNSQNIYGWEIDHILPLSAGGTEDIDNLQPLQWTNNRNKIENYPQWDCKITSNNNVNIEIPTHQGS